MALSVFEKKLSRILLYVVGATVILLFIFWSSHVARPVLVIGAKTHENVLYDINNDTLGVGKIFVVNLPSRPDKRDDVILGASISDFHVEFVDGVNPDDISPQSYPYNWNHDHQPSEYAARRAHLNALQRVVDERLGSAIIMEDDSDWDISIKNQLQTIALGTRALQGTGNDSAVSPYGDDWDILWLGHCGVTCGKDLPFYVTQHDSTVLPPHHFLPYWREPPPVNKPDDSRLICDVTDGVCSVVYAVNCRGARRLISALSVNPIGIAEEIDIGAQFDVSLGRMCGSNYLRCFAPYPSLFGGRIGLSDIHSDEGDGKPKAEKPSSHGVMYSTLLNINRILGGESTVQSTWDDAVAKAEDLPVVGGTVYTPGENGLHETPVVAPSERRVPF